MKGALLMTLVIAACSGSDFRSGPAKGAAGEASGAGAPDETGSTSGSTSEAGRGGSSSGEAGAPDASGTGGSSTTRVCTPGVTQTCLGPGQCKGAQACAKDGSEWEGCECAIGPHASGGSGGDSAGAGGEPSSGGAGGSGDAPASGGAGGSSGGSGGVGGAPLGGSGGSAGTAGLAGAGGSGPTCVTSWTVSNDGFVQMPAKGGACWSGYAFAGGDKSSTVTFPGGGTDFSHCNGALELTGTIGAATAENMYSGNVYFGFRLAQVAGSSASGKVTPMGSGLSVTCEGCSMPPMRVQIGDGTTTWCANLTSGTAIPYSGFTQQCYSSTPGAAYAKQPISSIQLSIPGTAMAATFDVTLLSVVEN